MLQRAADYLLEHQDQFELAAPAAADAEAAASEPSTPDTPGTPASDAVAKPAINWQPGDGVDTRDECGQWHEAVLLKISERAVKVHYENWSAEWDEWIDRTGSRFRPRSGSANRGPGALQWTPAEDPPESRAPAEAAGERASSSSSASKPRGRSSWLWRNSSSASSKRRAAEKAARLCPSQDADFFPSDAGVARLVDTLAEGGPAEEGATSDAATGRWRVTAGPDAGRVGVLVERERESEGSEAAALQELVVTDPETGVARTVSCAASDLEPVAEELVAGTAPYLVRHACSQHRVLAVMHARKATLSLLCEPRWLRAADEDEGSAFRLSDLGDAPSIIRVLKLCSYWHSAADAHASDSAAEALGMVWEALSALLRDRSLLEHVGGFADLPGMLAQDMAAFLARCTTSVRQIESAHPSGSAHVLHALQCEGACMMQLTFDSRSCLSKGARLGLYMDEACTQQILCFEGDDLASSESLWVPAACVWVHYECEQNREHAWGFKLRATPVQWRVLHEATVVEKPFESGWELLDLLLEDAPEQLLQPAILGNFLRYLQHGRAPHKERVAQVLQRLLWSQAIEDVRFEWGAFQTLEGQLAWHELLCQQQPGGAVLLPLGSQCILDMLVVLRERMQAAGLSPWASSLTCMDDVKELSALSLWLLHPDEYTPARASMRHAMRAANLVEISPDIFMGWPLSLDEALVHFVDQTVHASGSSALAFRATQLAGDAPESMASAHPELAKAPEEARCLRFALLQRFNQLVTKLLPLVHTGCGGGQSNLLGGRLCGLRALIFLEVKLAVLHRALADTATDADAPNVVLDRIRASRLRTDPRADPAERAQGTVFAQLHEQLGRVHPRALCRPDKAFRVNFVGESVDDHGGPYREALCHICSELHCEALTLPLFIPTPNGRDGVGSNRDAFVPSPAATAPEQLEWLCFIGQLLGLALRQKETQLGFSMPSSVWKQLVDEPMHADDLAALDEHCRTSLDKLRRIDEEGVDAETFEDVIVDTTFTTTLSDGAEVELVPNGGRAAVTFGNRGAFCDAVLAARLQESQRQCDALLQGLSYVVPQRLLPLFTWRQLELLACGVADVSVEELRAHTKYGVGVSANQRHIRYFWTAMRRFTPQQRSLFLRFVWGRSRLPVNATEWGDAKFTLHPKQTARADTHFPVAHTCFFSLELPAYSSASVCYERLLYAVTHCQSIDIDTTSSARENRDLQSLSDDDEGEVDE